MSHSRVVTLRTALLSTDLAEQEKALDAATTEKLPELFPALIAVLRKAQRNTIWNGAAYALRELGDARAAAELMAKIQDPITKGSRGTLLYALAVFDCTPYVGELVDLIIHDNFEVSRKAFQILEDLEGDPDPDVVATARVKLAAASNRDDLDEDQRAIIEQTAALISITRAEDEASNVDPQ